jgi:glycosyltransferase involved in cell wall biosynthesis
MVGLCGCEFMLIAILAWQRWQSPCFDRIFDYDEFYSTEYHTWAGVDRNGETVSLRRCEDIRRLPAPTLQQLGMGVYRSLGVWKNTNNHIFNNLLVNFAMIRGNPTERTIRIPAFIGAIGFAAALYVLLQFMLGWRYAATWIPLWAFAFPYVAQYGMEVRGYSWMLCLQVLFLIVACRSACRPTSIFWGTTQALLAICCIMNIVSLSIHWILPVYLIFWLFPPELNNSPLTVEHKKQWRKNLIVQLLAIGAVGFVFLMPRLPYTIRFSSQAGLSISGLGSLVSHLHGYISYLFPGITWEILGCLGLVGVLTACRSKESRCWGLAFFAVIFLSLFHFWASKTVLYARTMSYQLPLLFVGAGYLIEWIGRRAKNISRYAALAGALGLTMVVVWQSLNLCFNDGDLRKAFQEIADRIDVHEPSQVYAVVTSEGYYMPKCLPRDWLTYLDDVASANAVKKLVFVSQHSDAMANLLEMQQGKKTTAILQPLKNDNTTWVYKAQDCQATCVNVHAEPFASVQHYPDAATSLVLWYPDPMRVGIIGTPVIDMLGEAGVPYIRRNRRFPAHLDFYTQLYAIEFTVASAEEWANIQQIVQAGLQRFGGHVICLVGENASKESLPPELGWRNKLMSDSCSEMVEPQLKSPRVSIIIPCRNEASWIEQCLKSVADNDFPKDQLEVLVLDGMSDDGTRPILDRLAVRYPFVRILDNPRRIVPVALNLGIAAARGEIIVRLDAHNQYPTDYISKLVRWLEKSGADDVGGLWITLPSNGTALAKAIALGCTHPFGVGNAKYRTGVTEPCEVDTVPFGCYRRDVFDRIGLFDEELIRNQDIEFNLRLRAAGGSILLVPNVASYYYARNSLKSLWRTHYQNGYFNVRVVQKTHGHITLRQTIPPLFVLALLTTSLLSPWFDWMGTLFMAGVAVYLLPLIVCSLAVAFRQGVKVGLLFATVIPVLHFSSGFGTLEGILDFSILRKRITAADTRTISITRDSETPKRDSESPPRDSESPLRNSESLPRDAGPSPAPTCDDAYKMCTCLVHNPEFVPGVLSPSPSVSIIMPCRNEARCIRACIESILAMDFPKERLEVFILDGMSDDGTRAIIEEYAARHSFFHMIDNPRKIVPTALNLGIAAARGEIIMRLDGHYRYPTNYITRLVQGLQESGADGIGGRLILEPANDTAMAKAIAFAVTHRLGIGNAYYRIGCGDKPCWVDTALFGCYRREVFERVGMFDEEMVRNQDIELNYRLARGGGRILMLPDVVLYGHARDTLGKMVRMYFQYACFNPLVIRKSGGRVTMRQITTPTFALSLLITGILSPWFWPARWLLAAILVAYSVPLMITAVSAAARYGWRCGLAMFVVLPTLHLSHGFGFLKGVFDLLLRRHKSSRHVEKIPLTR